MSKNILAICFLLTLLVYLPSLFNGFVWDDEFLILYNPVIKHWSGLIKGLGAEFFYATQERPHLSFYRPFVTAFNTLSYQLFNFKPFFYHLTNILIHLFNVALLWTLLGLVFRAPLLATGLATAAFALHPIHTENVAFISGRTDLLATSFFLLALIAYLSRYRNPVMPPVRFLLASLVFFALGLLCKELVVVLPLIIIVFDYFLSPWQGLGHYFRNEKKQLVMLLISFFALIFIYALLRLTVISDINMIQHSVAEISVAMLTMTKVFYHYLLLTILPFHQMSLYEGYFNPVRSLFELRLVLALIGVVIILLLAIHLFLQKNSYFLPLFWFIVTLLPAAMLIPLGIVFAERFLYMPSIALSLFLTIILQQIDIKGRLGLYRAVTIVILLLLIYYSAMTFSRSFIWKDTLSLWTDAVKKNPNSSIALISLGEAQLAQNDLEQAEINLNKAFPIASPGSQDTIYLRRAEIEHRRGQHAEAMKTLADIKDPKPLTTRILVLKADIANKQGQAAEAEKLLRQAIAGSPQSISAHLGLAELLYQQKTNYEEIIELCDVMLGIQPRYDKALLYKGLALRALKQYDKAIAVFKEAIRLRPDNPEPYLFLGDLYEWMAQNIDGKYWQEALTTYGRLLLRDDTNISGLLNMGLVYARLGKQAEAHNLWLRILKIDPDNQAALHNLTLLNKEVTGLQSPSLK